MYRLDLIPFLRITLAFAIGVICGAWGAVSLIIPITPIIRKYWIYTVIICSGSLISTISTYTQTPPLEQKIEVMVVVGDSISNYHAANIITISNEPLNYPIPLLLSTPQSINPQDTIKTDIYIEPSSKYITAKKSLLSSLEREGIKYIGYTYNDCPILRKPNLKISYPKKIQQLALDKLSKLTTSPENIAILKAMMLGYKSEISDSSKKLYQKSGVSHALAISGLHVGIIFLMLNILLRPMNIFLPLRLTKTAIIIALMILYALTTGASASVVRAVIMFSLFQLSLLTITSRYHAYNILFFAAFAMITINPTVIYKVSFQLSYAALLAIIFFAPRINRLITTKSKLLKFLATTSLLSLSITLFTLPLILYYFKQAAILSFLSNIAMTIAMPALFILASLFIIYPFPIFDDLIDIIFSLLNHTLNSIAQLPYSYISYIEFDLTDLVLSYSAILLITISIINKPQKNQNLS